MASALELLLLAQSSQTPVVYATTTTLINATTDIPVNGLSVPVLAGATYSISAVVAYVTASAGGAPVFSFHAPAVSGAVIPTYYLDSTAGTVSAAGVLNGSLTHSLQGPAMTSSDTCAFVASGLVTFSAAGSISIQAHTTAGADTFTCQPLSYLSMTALP